MSAISDTPAAHGGERAQPDIVSRLLVGTSAVLAALSVLKFVLLKPIVFLLIAVLYVAAIAMRRRRRVGAAITIAVLNVLMLAVVATRLGETFDTVTDALVVLVGVPAALIGLASAALLISRRNRAHVRRKPLSPHDD